jgi:hypothetical protein
MYIYIYFFFLDKLIPNMPPRTSNKVKVYVRTRPSSNFASEMLAIGRDSRVSFLLKNSFFEKIKSFTDN